MNRKSASIPHALFSKIINIRRNSKFFTVTTQMRTDILNTYPEYIRLWLVETARCAIDAEAFSDGNSHYACTYDFEELAPCK
jgi:hypothetical protein